MEEFAIHSRLVMDLMMQVSRRRHSHFTVSPKHLSQQRMNVPVVFMVTIPLQQSQSSINRVQALAMTKPLPLSRAASATVVPLAVALQVRDGLNLPSVKLIHWRWQDLRFLITVPVTALPF
jgi:hypothetical protein